MEQFDLYVNTDKETNKTYPYFVDVQNELINELNSRVVIPLTPVKDREKQYPKNLCPVIKIRNKRFVLLTHQITSVSIAFLKKRQDSLAAYRDEIVASIDFLITGI